MLPFIIPYQNLLHSATPAFCARVYRFNAVRAARVGRIISRAVPFPHGMKPERFYLTDEGRANDRNNWSVTIMGHSEQRVTMAATDRHLAHRLSFSSFFRDCLARELVIPNEYVTERENDFLQAARHSHQPPINEPHSGSEPAGKIIEAT